MDEQPTCRQTIANLETQKEKVMMILTKPKRVTFFVLLCAAVAIGSAQLAAAQTSDQPARPSVSRDDDTNLDTQLYLIYATNREVEDGKLPIALESPMKRLRETLTFKHFNLAA